MRPDQARLRLRPFAIRAVDQRSQISSPDLTGVTRNDILFFHAELTFDFLKEIVLAMDRKHPAYVQVLTMFQDIESFLNNPFFPEDFATLPPVVDVVESEPTSTTASLSDKLAAMRSDRGRGGRDLPTMSVIPDQPSGAPGSGPSPVTVEVSSTTDGTAPPLSSFGDE